MLTPSWSPARRRQAHPSVANRLRTLIKAVLPWYSQTREAARNRHTDAIVRRSVVIQERAARITAQYAAAERRRRAP